MHRKVRLSKVGIEAVGFLFKESVAVGALVLTVAIVSGVASARHS